MGRRVPADHISLIHPLLHFSFLAAAIAASIAIITAICGVRFRKKSSPPSAPLDLEKELNASSPPSITVATTDQSVSENPPIKKTEHKTETETENNGVQIKELPLPPALQQPKDSFRPVNMKRVTSERRASFSLSIKVPRSLSVARNWDQMEDKIKGKLKTEDSVWKKTIILGEKCVPDEEDPVIYEGKGKRISAYHPKSYSTMSISRQDSFHDPDALSVPQTQEQRIINT